VAHRAAPTARCGTTKSADRRDHQGDRQTGEPPRAGCGHRPAHTTRGPEDEERHGDRQRAMRELDERPAGQGRWPQATLHEREVREGEPRAGPGDPRAEQHLSEHRHARHRHQPAGQPAGRRWQRPAGGAIGDDDRQGQDRQRHGQVRGNQLSPELLDHDLAAQQRLEDDKDAGDEGGRQEGAIVSPCGEEGDQADRRHQRPHRERRHETMAVLDPGVQLGGGNPFAEAGRPIGAAEP